MRSAAPSVESTPAQDLPYLRQLRRLALQEAPELMPSLLLCIAELCRTKVLAMQSQDGPFRAQALSQPCRKPANALRAQPELMEAVLLGTPGMPQTQDSAAQLRARLRSML